MTNAALGYRQEVAATGKYLDQGADLPSRLENRWNEAAAGHNFKTGSWEHAQHAEEVDSWVRRSSNES